MNHQMLPKTGVFGKAAAASVLLAQKGLLSAMDPQMVLQVPGCSKLLVAAGLGAQEWTLSVMSAHVNVQPLENVEAFPTTLHRTREGALVYVSLQVISQVCWTQEGSLTAMEGAAQAFLRVCGSDLTGAAQRCVSSADGLGMFCQLSPGGSNETVMSQLLNPQEPWRTAVRAVIVQEVIPRILSFILNKDHVLRRRTNAGSGQVEEDEGGVVVGRQVLQQ